MSNRERISTLQKCITLGEAYELFMLDGEARGFTRDSLRFYRDRFSILLRWCSSQSITTVQDLTATSIKLYLAGMQQRDLSSHYVHSHARAIRTLCRFLVREGLLDVSPFDKVKMPRLERQTPQRPVQALLAAVYGFLPKTM